MIFKRVLSLVFFLCCMLPLQAAPSSFVTDATGTIKAEQRVLMERASIAIDQQGGIQVVTLVIDTLGQDSIEGYATRIFEQWGIGQKGKNNGILFLIALKEKKTKIEVGYGLEELIPDGRAGEILDTAVLPSFKQGDLSTGIFQGHMGMIKVIASAHNLSLDVPLKQGKAVQKASAGSRLMGLLLVIIILLVISRRGGGGLLPFFLLMGGLGGMRGDDRSSGFGSFGGGGFGGFGGGSSGGGGAGRDW